MHATHLYPRRSLIALAAAALATMAMAIPRLAGEGFSFGGGDKAGSAAPLAPATVQFSPQPKPYWVKDPLASPLPQLEAPVVPATHSTK
jgi:hypothetical protein